MSIMQPQSPPKSKPTLRTRLTSEWDHFEEMPSTRLLLLLLPSTLLLVIDPLVPIAAYLLQIWAGSSGMWRERWASLVAGAKHCGILLAALAMYLLLDHAQISLIPSITYAFQVLWRTYLPGILSLSPIDGLDLLARSLLLLPLAPILAVYYERVDPRSGRQLNRILLTSDLKLPKPPKQKTAPVAPPTPAATPTPPTPAPPPTASQQTPPKKTTATTTTAASQQITIESFLASQPAGDKKSNQNTPAPSTNTDAPAQDAPPPTTKKPINFKTLKE